MTVVDLNNFDISKLKLGKSGRAIRLFYEKEPLQICTSTMYIPFGVKSLVKEWSNYSEFYMDCFLNNSKSDISVNFKESLDKLDLTINDLVKNDINLFDTKVERAKQDFQYSPILRENGTYPKLMKLQLTRDKNGNFESYIFNQDKTKVVINENNIEAVLSKGKSFKAIIECVKVWYYNGKVGTIWKIVQLKFSEKTVETNDEKENVYNSLMIDD